MSHIETLIFGLFRRSPPRVVYQTESADCGLACLAMILGWFNYEIDIATLRQRQATSAHGTTVHQLIELGGRVDLVGRAVRCSLTALESLRSPCILHWEFNHFVVLWKATAFGVVILDPALGVRHLSMEDVSAAFTGVALEFVPGKAFTKRRDQRRLRLGDLWQWTKEARSAAIRAIVLSVIIESFGLLTPLYMQFVVDQAIAKGDLSLLTVLAMAFGLITIFNSLASALRSLVVQFLANVTSYSMGARLFRHLLRLPVDFIQKRRIGDLAQRFHSLEPIKQFAVSGGIISIIDGALSLVTLSLMLLYSAPLTLLASGSVGLYSILRFLARTSMRQYVANAAAAEAREQTAFLETLEGFETVKICNAEASRERDWLNAFVAKLNTLISLGNQGIIFQTIGGLMAGLSDILIVYFAARMVVDGRLTIGIMTAFLAYKSQFTSRTISLVDQLIQYRMLDVQLERVSDIALAFPEQAPALPKPDSNRNSVQGEFEFQNVVFRYATGAPPILRDVSFRVRAGEFIVIAGPSGQGKSTLLKLMLGLYPQESGNILVDGVNLAQFDISRLRRATGVVTQDDRLFTGTIADNIALFETGPDLERVRECAHLALLDDEVMTMPMQYWTPVGSLGNCLSAGQCQRLMLARALYRRPTVLLLDEVTSHLGRDAEIRLMERLRCLKSTRIVTSHSSVVMESADRVIRLMNGTLVEA